MRIPSAIPVWLSLVLLGVLPAQAIKEARLDYGLTWKFEAGDAKVRVTPAPLLAKVLDWRHDRPAQQGLTGPSSWKAPVAFSSVAHRGSAARKAGRDLLLAEALLEPGEKASDRMAVTLAMGRFYGRHTLHAWTYRELAGEPPEDRADDLPIFTFAELVETRLGQGPAPDRASGPAHSGRWLRIMVLKPRRAELHLMGEVEQVLPSTGTLAAGAVPRNRIRSRGIHFRFVYADGELTIETPRDGDKGGKDPKIDGLPRLRHGPYVARDKVVDPGRGEIRVESPASLLGDHVLFATGDGVTRVAKVASCADWKQWMLRGRGRRHPPVLEDAVKSGPVPHQVGSWLFVSGKGKKSSLVFRCPLGIEVSLRSDGMLNGLPATRRLLRELVESVFVASPLGARYPAPLQPEKK